MTDARFDNLYLSPVLIGIPDVAGSCLIQAALNSSMKAATNWGCIKWQPRASST